MSESGKDFEQTNDEHFPSCCLQTRNGRWLHGVQLLETEAQKLAGHKLHMPMDMFCLAGKVLRFLQISSNIYKIRWFPKNPNVQLLWKTRQCWAEDGRRCLRKKGQHLGLWGQGWASEDLSGKNSKHRKPRQPQAPRSSQPKESASAPGGRASHPQRPQSPPLPIASHQKLHGFMFTHWPLQARSW